MYRLIIDHSRYDYIADPGTGHTNAQVRLCLRRVGKFGKLAFVAATLQHWGFSNYTP